VLNDVSFRFTGVFFYKKTFTLKYKNKEFISCSYVLYSNRTNHPVSRQDGCASMLDPRIVAARAFLLRLQSNLHASRCSIYMYALCTIYGETLCISIHDVLSSLLLERAYTSTCTNTHNAELAFMHILHRCIDTKFG